MGPAALLALAATACFAWGQVLIQLGLRVPPPVEIVATGWQSGGPNTLFEQGTCMRVEA